jgi:hypothetical protein
VKPRAVLPASGSHIRHFDHVGITVADIGTVLTHFVQLGPMTPPTGTSTAIPMAVGYAGGGCIVALVVAPLSQKVSTVRGEEQGRRSVGV